MSKKKLITFLVCLTMSLGAAGTMASCDFLGGGSSGSVSEESSIEESTPDESEVEDSDPEESDPEDSDPEESDSEESSAPEAEEATVSFEGVEEAIDAQTIAVGEKVEKPADPVKEYYNFDGWYNGEDKWDFDNDVVEGDLVLTAKFTAKTYVVTFVDFDNVETEVSYTVENVADFAMPEVPAAPENCNNARWSLTAEECTVFNEDGITVYALCDANVYYTVTFVNGDESTSLEVGENLLINQKPADPTKDYYNFDGWYNGEAKWDFAADKVNENVTLTAKYVAKTYSVKFVDVNGDEVAVKEYTVENAADFEAPEVPAAPQYFTNGAWDKAADAYLVYSEEVIVVTAVYERITYTVSFVDGDTVVEMTVGADLLVEESPADPIKAYYTFDGWYNGDTKWNFTADKVYENVTLTAKYVAIEYVVQFVDFDGEVTEVTYNADNVADFAMPEAPEAPEHYENARWNKTAEECLVYSDEAIVVEAICDAKTYTVSFANCDVEAVGVVYGNTVNVAAPTKAGYAFKGWTLDGAAYDMSAPVAGDITLVATWYVEQAEDVKSVMSATDVYNSLQFEAGYGWQEGGVQANPNKSWYFDSDYNGRTGAGALEENKFAEVLEFVLSVDGGGGTDANGRETYVILPAINYSLYSKVDFAYVNKGSMKSVDIYGVNVSQYGGNNLMISIRTDENGTKLYFAELNSAGTSDFPKAVIDLPAEVANGEEGLQINVSVTGWMKFTMTDFHMTSNYLDYSADLAGVASKLPAENELTGSAAEYDVVKAYLNAINYMTDYEKASFEVAPIVKVAGEMAICNKIVATEDNTALLAAIEEYRAFSALLSEEDKATELHQSTVAAINAIIDAKFNAGTTSVVVNNVASATLSGEIAAPTVEASASQFKGVYGTFSYMTGNPTAPAMFTFNVFDFSAYDEVEFGVAMAVTKDKGIINVCGATYSIPASLVGHWYKMKAVIADGYLTLVDAGSSNDVKTRDTNYSQYGYFFKVALPESVLNGSEALTMGVDTADGWMWFEVTEMNTKTTKITVQNVESNVVANAAIGGETNIPVLDGSNCHFKGQAATFSYMTGNPTVPAMFTFNKMDYSAYDEVSFYVAMAVTADVGGTINVCGETYSIPSNLIGHWYYMQAVIKNGYLMLIDAGSHNDVKTRDTNFVQYGYFFKVALPENVLNGTEALTIGVETGASYMWFEVTEITTSKVVDQKIDYVS